jgi:predicted nucleotidyltransferase component of viral defense system
MISSDFITEWRSHVPWITNDQVEQDLVISKALVEIYKNTYLQKKIAFRGGTALHKLHLEKPYRYSEDLDFIQIEPESIGETLDQLKLVLDSWLGTPKRETKKDLVKLIYRFESTDGNPLKLKVEINSREHFLSKKLQSYPYTIKTRWYSGTANINSLELAWLLGSKLRALYQRKKGRDLFDLFVVLKSNLVPPQDIVTSFLDHMNENKITRANFEENLYDKLKSPIFNSDLTPLLSGHDTFDMENAVKYILKNLIALLPGNSWKKLEKLKL